MRPLPSGRMDIAKHPVAEHSADAGIGFMFQQIEKRRHGVAYRFPAWGHVARRTQVNSVIPIAGKRSGFDQASGHTRLEQFAIPLLWPCAPERRRWLRRSPVRPSALLFRMLPVAARRQRIAALAVVLVTFGSQSPAALFQSVPADAVASIDSEWYASLW